MLSQYTSVRCTRILRPYNHSFPVMYCLVFIILLSACNTSPSTKAAPSPTSSSAHTATVPPTTTIVPSPTTITPAHYTSHVIFSGAARPDDLVFDNSGNLLFGDFYNGTISRINANGSVMVLFRGINGPEGMIVLPDNTMIVAEQRTNRILLLTPGAASPKVLRTLPGTPSSANCKDGVDGIAFDPTTNTVIVPDSPTGEVYRMSLDGKTLTLLTSGIVRPVGATVDSKGTIYVADECGGAIWKIIPNGKTTQIGGFAKPDDVVLDSHGNLLVIDLLPSIHALIRLNLITGKRETLASAGFIEPQGLLVDAHDQIFVSDDYANKIVEYIPT